MAMLNSQRVIVGCKPIKPKMHGGSMAAPQTCSSTKLRPMNARDLFARSAQKKGCFGTGRNLGKSQGFHRKNIYEWTLNGKIIHNLCI